MRKFTACIMVFAAVMLAYVSARDENNGFLFASALMTFAAIGTIITLDEPSEDDGDD